MFISQARAQNAQLFAMCCLLFLGFPGGCGAPPALPAIAHSTSPQNVLIREVYGGGIYGSFHSEPFLSIYGDGTVIEGAKATGKFSSVELATLLDLLVNTYHVFTILPNDRGPQNDDDFTFLELNFNSSQTVLGEDQGGPTSGQANPTAQARVGDVLEVIHHAVAQVRTVPYQSARLVLLARQLGPGETASDQRWPLTSFTLAQAAAAVCGTSPGRDCLLSFAPQRAILLTPGQSSTLLPLVDASGGGSFQERGRSYRILLRSLLPDEGILHGVIMSGSFSSGGSLPLLDGSLPLPAPIQA